MKLKCENRVEKSSRYLSARNVSGSSFQKCGNVAKFKDQFGNLLCRKCAKDCHDAVEDLIESMKGWSDERSEE